MSDKYRDIISWFEVINGELLLHLSDFLLLISLAGPLFVRLLRCLGILDRLRFSFPLSPSLSDVRSMSLLAIRSVTTAGEELLDFSSAGVWVSITINTG